MVLQEDFDVEQFMDKYETNIKYNMGETCVDSLSVNGLIDLVDPSGGENIQERLSEAVFNTKLTYGHIRGSEKLKNAIATIYDDNGQGSPPLSTENIVITNGAIGANFLLFYTLVNAHDHVVVVDPSYQQLSSVPNMFSRGNVSSFCLEFEKGYKPDLEKLSRMIKENKTKLVVINNPNNPVGFVWDNSLLGRIVDICRENDTYLFCDEVYRPLYHSVPEPPKSIIQFGYEKTVSTGSVSKAFSFAGLRLGWIATHDDVLVRDIFSKRDYNTISISTADDILATFALENYKVILQRSYDICRRNMKLIEDFIEESQGAALWVKPIGGSTCFIKFANPELDTFNMASDLAENHGVLLVPGETFANKKGFVRIGFGNSTDDLKGGLSVLKQWLKEKNYWTN